ncbi:hypothetical protein UCDDA912_g09679 [Diaporthe ampelina]|uniref:Uncharacterized protein n=1 Tax=Diaporthe ampelina TaxID=1214573 RepID=A0A0G2F844_9PEZI|nr:hypothetical protein UCDDA912_g09679 [Diaporthe ampelina]
MAPQNAKKREYSAAELAMLDDIGAGRVDTLPLEDTGAVPRNGAAMKSVENGRTGTNNRWNQAIAEGAFEDEDAAFVAGQEELANGQLARMRRAADLSYMAVHRGFDYNDRRLRQNHNGQVGPRAQFFRGERGPARAGLAHTGNGPVELRGAVRNSRRAPLPAHTPNATTQRPAAKAPQEEVRVRSTTEGMELPDGHPVQFQAPVTFASPAFLDRTAEYPGTIYLVAGPTTADDQIILHIDEDRVEDVKRCTKEYVDYLSDSDRLILQFKDESAHITWFVVMFRQRNVMVSFTNALRKFLDRLKAPSPSPETTNNDPTKTISVAILEDIVSWAMQIVTYVRDSGPAELANADALPGIVRGASAAVLMEKYAGFSGLDSKSRVAFVDEVCAPQVFERFKRRMLEDAAKKGPTEAVSATAPSIQKSLDVQEITPSERPRPKYTIQELMQLGSKAVDPPDFLTELRYLPEMNPENRALIQQIIQRARGLHYSSLPGQTPQVSERATHILHANIQKTGYKLDDHFSPARARKSGSRAPDAISAQAAQVPPAHTPGITVSAPVETPIPEEPLVTIHGDMNGLNSSRHNTNGVDLLGQSSGQFTGALSRNKSHLEDLMLIDRVEDFDVIRANDPEVAEIADRFARVHFDEGPST